jgi:hypothetical protein
LLLFVATSASAGLITNTTSDSFIDETTGLEWMDFGVNDTQTYQQVVGALPTTYVGWEVASLDQVLELWKNAFGGLDTTTLDIEGPYYARYVSTEFTGNSMLNVFTKMGYSRDDMTGSLGMFEDSTGGMSYVAFNRIEDNDAASTWQFASVVGLNEDYNHIRTDTREIWSTMLVKKANVPEPSTLTILALGLMSLASLRKRESK